MYTLLTLRPPETWMKLLNLYLKSDTMSYVFTALTFSTIKLFFREKE
jgi:hypothetical protein